MAEIQLRDKKFRTLYSSETIQKAIKETALNINKDLAGTDPLFLCVLNGSFLFVADMMKHLTIDCQVSFVKLATYHGGMESTGKVKTLMGLTENLTDRTVVVVEDIVDSGITMENVVNQVKAFNPKQIKLATLLFKPACYKKDLTLDYVGIEVPDEFLVGYGLDYDGFGRNLQDIYTLNE